MILEKTGASKTHSGKNQLQLKLGFKKRPIRVLKLLVPNHINCREIIILNLMQMTVIAHDEIRLACNKTIDKLIVILIIFNQIP